MFFKSVFFEDKPQPFDLIVLAQLLDFLLPNVVFSLIGIGLQLLLHNAQRNRS